MFIDIQLQELIIHTMCALFVNDEITLYNNIPEM